MSIRYGNGNSQKGKLKRAIRSAKDRARTTTVSFPFWSTREPNVKDKPVITRDNVTELLDTGQLEFWHQPSGGWVQLHASRRGSDQSWLPFFWRNDPMMGTGQIEPGWFDDDGNLAVDVDFLRRRKSSDD